MTPNERAKKIISDMTNNFRGDEWVGDLRLDITILEIEQVIREAVDEEREGCARTAAGPDEAYLHGCSCRDRIRIRKDPA